MNVERWQQIDELFDAVREIPSERRKDFLSEKSGGDEDLKREVLSLLEAEKQSDKFLENSAMNVAAKNLAGENNVDARGDFLNRQIGTYKIENMLGAGGMGEVYLAQDSKLNRKVALKILPAEFVSDTERLKRFEIEARAVSALNHPNIVTIYDVGKAGGVSYISTEFVEGKTLRELIGSNLKLKEVLAIISQAAEALAAAHNAGVVHRDIKPENIMVRPDGYVKVLDFGLAKLSETNQQNASSHTVKGAVMGTLAYMSPEQASGEPVGNCADVWSLGVVLYEMLTGKSPFKAANRQATLNRILSTAPRSVTSSDVSLPAELDRILEKALEKDCELRYQSAADFRTDLKRLQREIDSSPSWSVSQKNLTVESGNNKSRKNLLIGAFVAFAVLLGGAAWFFFLRSGAPGDASEWERAKNIQLTDQAGTEFYPSLSPDGKSFVFAAKTNGNFDIFLQRVGGRSPRNLTEGSKSADTQPVYSPDGKYIAFRSGGMEGGGIFVMEETSENPRRVSDFGYHPSWSPDGREIVVSGWNTDLPSGKRNPSELTVINIDTGQTRILIDGFVSQPSWSPHGQRIAYWVTQSGGRRDVATISAGGGEPIMVTGFAGTNWNPVWSPDGKFLYFASDRGGSMAFWRVPIDEATGKVLGEPEIVQTPAKYNRHLAFSRDGKRLIYVQTNEQSNLKAVEFDVANEKIIGEPFWITRRDQEVLQPQLSPDGQQFVMQLARLTQNDIVTVNREGAIWRDLTNDEFFDKNARWSPDGKQIAFSSDRTGNYEIWTMNADGTNPQQKTFSNGMTASNPVWSPDGAKLSYDINHKAYLLDLTKSFNEQTTPMLPGTEKNKFSMTWDWSSDGRKLAGLYTDDKGDSNIGFYSFETNQWEALQETKAPMLWLPDSRRLVFSKENKIFITDIETKKNREIFSLPQEQISSAGISRDGKLLYYTVFTSESDIWLLDASPSP